MSFTSKNLQTKRNSMGFIKGATLFFLGMSCILFIARAFDIGTVAPNAVQYISKVFLTNDGSNSSATGIILDGTTNGGVTITNIPNKIVLGTDANGKIIASTSGAVYNFISGLLGGSQGATGIMGTGITNGRVSNGTLYLQYLGANGTGIWNVGSVQGPAGATGSIALTCSNGQVAKSNGTTWICGTDELGGAGSTNINYVNTITGMSFNPTSNMLTLYISGANAVTATINLSGVNNWNSAYTRTSTTGNTLGNRYTNTGINITSIATLHCSLGEIPKATSTGWICAPDLVGAGGGSALWTMSGNDMFNDNRNGGKVGIGFEGTPQATLQVSDTLIVGPSTNQITNSINSVVFGKNNTINKSSQSLIGGENNQINNGTTHSFIGAGYGNTIASDKYKDKDGNRKFGGMSLIGGGSGNIISLNSSVSSIVGGYKNQISTGSDYGFIGGGESNSISSSSRSFIGGGQTNEISINNITSNYTGTIIDASFIGGGITNKIINAMRSFIGGGYGNVISDTTANFDSGYSVIAGGYENFISGSSYSFVAGGIWNIISGSSYSFVGGKNARALHDNSFVRNSDGSSPFATAHQGSFIINAPFTNGLSIGGVGINTNDPHAALDVNGDIKGSTIVGDTMVKSRSMLLRSTTGITSGAICSTPGTIVFNGNFYGCTSAGHRAQLN